MYLFYGLWIVIHHIFSLFQLENPRVVVPSYPWSSWSCAVNPPTPSLPFLYFHFSKFWTRMNGFLIPAKSQTLQGTIGKLIWSTIQCTHRLASFLWHHRSNKRHHTAFYKAHSKGLYSRSKHEHKIIWCSDIKSCKTPILFYKFVQRKCFKYWNQSPAPLHNWHHLPRISFKLYLSIITNVKDYLCSLQGSSLKPLLN